MNLNPESCVLVHRLKVFSKFNETFILCLGHMRERYPFYAVDCPL